MTILIGALVVLACWLAFVAVGHGYANTVEWLAWRLRRHARSVRRMHVAREAVLKQRWEDDDKPPVAVDKPVEEVLLLAECRKAL